MCSAVAPPSAHDTRLSAVPAQLTISGQMPQLPTAPSPTVCLVRSVDSHQPLEMLTGFCFSAGPVAQNVMEQSAKTSAELSNLAASRRPPAYTAATGQPLTHYHSFFSELLSWNNPRMSRGPALVRARAGADNSQGLRPLPMPPSSPSSSRLGTSTFCGGFSSSPGWPSASPSPPRSPGRPS